MLQLVELFDGAVERERMRNSKNESVTRVLLYGCCDQNELSGKCKRREKARHVERVSVCVCWRRVFQGGTRSVD